VVSHGGKDLKKNEDTRLRGTLGKKGGHKTQRKEGKAGGKTRSKKKKGRFQRMKNCEN